jgi:hypothetical protein
MGVSFRGGVSPIRFDADVADVVLVRLSRLVWLSRPRGVLSADGRVGSHVTSQRRAPRRRRRCSGRGSRGGVRQAVLQVAEQCGDFRRFEDRRFDEQGRRSPGDERRVVFHPAFDLLAVADVARRRLGRRTRVRCDFRGSGLLPHDGFSTHACPPPAKFERLAAVRGKLP